MTPINNNLNNTYFDENWYEDSKEDWENNAPSDGWGVIPHDGLEESRMKDDNESESCKTISQNSEGMTPLHSAVQSRNLELAKSLLSTQKNSSNIKDHFGRTPAMLAFLNDDKEMLKIFGDFKVSLKEFHAAFKNIIDFSALIDQDNTYTLEEYLKSSRLAVGACKIIHAITNKTLTENSPTKTLLIQLIPCIEYLNYAEKIKHFNFSKQDIIKKIVDYIVTLNKKRTYLRNLMFIFAIKEKNIQDIEAIIRENEFDLMITDSEKNNPLHLLAKNGSSLIIKTLMNDPQFQSAASEKNNDGFLPIHLALIRGNLSTFIAFLDTTNDNSEGYFRNDLGRTLLHFAAKNNHYELCKHILKHDISYVHVRDHQGRSAIHEAVQTGNLKIVELLIESLFKDIKVDVMTINRNSFGSVWNALDDDQGITPLHLAAEAGFEDIFQFFINHRYASRLQSFDCKKGNDAICYAVMGGQVNLLKRFFAKADLSFISNYQCETLLHLAYKAGKIEMVEYLLQIFTNCNSSSNRQCNSQYVIFWDKRTLLHVAAEIDNFGLCKQILKNEKQLLQHRDSKGRSAIHYAARAGNLNIVELLIEELFKDCNEDVMRIKREPVHSTSGSVWMALDDDEGITPLHFAAEAGHEDIVMFFMKHPYASRLNNFITTNGDRVLSYTVMGGHINIFKILSSNPENRHLVNKAGETMLHLALKAKKFEMFEFLTQVHNDCECSLLQDSKGATPLHLAAGEGNKKLVELLLKDDKQKRLGRYRDAEGFSARQVAAIKANSNEISRLLDSYQPSLQDAREALQIVEMSWLSILEYIKDKAPQDTFKLHFKVIKAKTQLISEASNGQPMLNEQILQKINKMYSAAKSFYMILDETKLYLSSQDTVKIEEMAKEAAIIKKELQPQTLSSTKETVHNSVYLIDSDSLSTKIDLASRRLFERDPQLVSNLKETIKRIQKGDFSSEIEDLFSEISQDVISQPPLLSLVLLHILQTQEKIKNANAPEIFKTVKQFTNLSNLNKDQKGILQSTKTFKRFALYIINSFSKQNSFKFSETEENQFKEFQKIIISVIGNAALTQTEFGSISRCLLPIFTATFDPKVASQVVRSHLEADSCFQAELFIDEIPDGDLKNKAIDDILQAYLRADNWVWAESFIKSFASKMSIASRKVNINKYFLDVFRYANNERKAGRGVPMKHLKFIWNQLKNDLDESTKTNYSNSFTALGEDAIQFFKDIIKEEPKSKDEQSKKSDNESSCVIS